MKMAGREAGHFPVRRKSRNADKKKPKPENAEEAEEAEDFWGIAAKSAIISQADEKVWPNVTTPKDLCFLRFLCVSRFCC